MTNIMRDKEPNSALAAEVKQILTDELQDQCSDCPINGIEGAHGLEIIFDAKYGRVDDQDAIEAAHNLAKFVNSRCRLGASVVRQAGCFGPAGLHCNIDRL